MTSTTRPSWILVAFVAALYVAAGKLGLLLAFEHASATLVWAPSGLAVASLLLLGYGAWPGILSGALIVNVLTTGDAATSGAIAVGNTLEAVTATWLVRRWAGGAAAFERSEHTFRFVLLACFLPPALSAAVGVTTLAAAGDAPWAAFGSIWFTWWLGDASGILLVCPFIVLWATRHRIALRGTQALELSLLAALLVLGALTSFWDWFPGVSGRHPLAFLPIPMIVWAAVRFGPRESVTATLVLSALALWGTLRGSGPFVRQSPHESLLMLQAFMATMSLLCLPLAAGLLERRRTEDALARAGRELEERVRLRTAELADANRALESGIQELRRTEEELRRSGAELLRAQEVARMGNWEWDPGADRITGSRSFWRLLGRPAAAAGVSFVEFLRAVHPEDRERVRGALLRSGSELTPVALDLRTDEPPGSVRNLYLAGIPDDESGTAPLKLVGSVQDVTERKRAEEHRIGMERRLFEGQKLQAIGQLAAGIAHEINNPVGYILSNLETTLGYLDQLRPLLAAAPRPGGVDVDFLLKDFRDAMVDCKNGAGRIRDIVRDLRGFAHPDEETSAAADPNELVRRAIRLCWNEIKYKAAVHEDFGEVGPVRCRQNRIEQVLINLLVNAAQAMDVRGDIFIATRSVDGMAEIRIRDTGCGIPKEHQARLFEPFFTTKPVGKGTGLGLHVAREIVVGHGGSVQVSSEPGAGAEFVVRLPLAEADPREYAARSGPGEGAI